MTDARGNPKKANIQINAVAAKSRQRPRNLAINQTEAVEPANGLISEELGAQCLGRSAQEVAQPSVQRWIGWPSIDALKAFA